MNIKCTGSIQKDSLLEVRKQMLMFGVFVQKQMVNRKEEKKRNGREVHNPWWKAMCPLFFGGGGSIIKPRKNKKHKTLILTSNKKPKTSVPTFFTPNLKPT
jgi:hypothetical protein